MASACVLRSAAIALLRGAPTHTAPCRPKYDLNGTWKERRQHPTFKDTVNVTDMANIRLGRLDDDRRNLVGLGASTSQTVQFRAKEGPQVSSFIYTDARTHARTNARTHARTHTHARAHTHTHTHT